MCDRLLPLFLAAEGVNGEGDVPGGRLFSLLDSGCWSGTITPTEDGVTGTANLVGQEAAEETLRENMAPEVESFWEMWQLPPPYLEAGEEEASCASVGTEIYSKNECQR